MSANVLAYERSGLSTAALPLSSSAAESQLAARFELITTRAAFDALESAWNDLFARSARGIHMFQSFNWLWHWSNHFLPSAGASGASLAIVTAHVDDRLVMVWPLVREDLGPISQIGWMGEPVSQYGDALVDDLPGKDALMRAAWDFIVQESGADVVRLRRVRHDANVAPLFAELGLDVVGEVDAPYLSFDDTPTYAKLSEQHSSSLRRNRARQRRRLAERGSVSHHWHTEGLEAEALVALAFKYKVDWLDARGLYSRAFSDSNTTRFFADVTRADTHPAGCYVFALSSNGHPTAIEVGLRHKGRAAIHIVTYDLAYEKAAAGALLMEDSVRKAIEDGLDVFDFLAPAYDYKWEWTKTSVKVRDWAMPLTAMGRLYTAVYLRRLRGVLKRGVEALPLSVRRKLTGALKG